MLVDELAWEPNGKGSETAVVTMPDDTIFLAMRSEEHYWLHFYKKGGVNPANPSRSWLDVDKLTAQCVLYEVFG